MNSSVYIHVPFCRARCPYCDFYFVVGTQRLGTYLEALEREIELASSGPAAPVRGGPLASIYLGGGTPSVLPPGAVGALIERLATRWAPGPDAEITLEANPDDLVGDTGVGRTGLGDLRATGVNRLSLGLQALDPSILATLGREHDGAAGPRSIEVARAAGFDEISVDLIYAVPGQSLEGWLADLDRVLALRPEHLSCYELTFEPRTPLTRALRKGAIEAPDEETRLRYFLATSERLRSAGYEHYEVSSYARLDGRPLSPHRSRHNQGYWIHRPYLGLGPSAHSFDGSTRWWNHRSLTRWLGDLERGVRPIADRETIDAGTRSLERILLGLRTSDGLDRDAVLRTAEVHQLLSSWVDRGLIELDEERIRPTPAGLAVAEALARELPAS